MLLSRLRPSRLQRAGTPVVILIVALTLFSAGCGGDSDEGDGGAQALADKVAAAKEQAESDQKLALQKKADQLAKKDYETALATFEKGKSLEDDGKPKSAMTRYKSAAKKFKSAADRATKNESKHQRIAAQLEKFNKLRAQAEKKNAKNMAAREWKFAVESYQKAQRYLDEGNLVKAGRPVDDAVRDMEACLKKCDEKVSLSKDVEEMKAEVASHKKAAEEAKAMDLAPHDMVWGSDEEKLAEKELAKFEYDKALSHLQQARSAYMNALASSKQIALANASGRRPPERSNGGLDGGNGRTPAPDLGEIPIPDAGGDGGGGVDLASGVLDLFSVSPEYANGLLKLTYSLGSDFRKDIEILSGGRYLHFEGSDYVGRGIEDYVFAANTRGIFFLNAGFEDGVQVEFDLHVQLCLPDSPFFNVIVMAEGKKSYYASNFGTDIKILEDKRATKRIPSNNSLYNSAPGKWTNKREPRHIKMKYRKANEDEKGLLQVWYDGEECAAIRTDKYRAGRIGFSWNNVKFYIKDLQITGYLDEDWARKAIAEGGNKSDEQGGDDFDDF